MAFDYHRAAPARQPARRLAFSDATARITGDFGIRLTGAKLF
jgi:hypothetical protein